MVYMHCILASLLLVSGSSSELLETTDSEEFVVLDETGNVVSFLGDSEEVPTQEIIFDSSDDDDSDIP